MGRPGPARYAGPARRVFSIGVAGPVGSGKTALVETLCRALWPEVNLAVALRDRDPETAGAGCPFYEVLCDEQTHLYARMFRS